MICFCTTYTMNEYISFKMSFKGIYCHIRVKRWRIYQKSIFHGFCPNVPVSEILLGSCKKPGSDYQISIPAPAWKFNVLPVFWWWMVLVMNWMLHHSIFTLWLVVNMLVHFWTWYSHSILMLVLILRPGF